jgi:hypothetical protein
MEPAAIPPNEASDSINRIMNSLYGVYEGLQWGILRLPIPRPLRELVDQNANFLLTNLVHGVAISTQLFQFHLSSQNPLSNSRQLRNCFRVLQIEQTTTFTAA